MPTITGFGDRLLNEVKKIALKDIKIKIYAPPERKVSEPSRPPYLSRTSQPTHLTFLLPFTVLDLDRRIDLGQSRNIQEGPSSSFPLHSRLDAC